MSAPSAGRSFLLESFREFYAEVVRLKGAVAADPWGIGAGERGEGEEADPRAAAVQAVARPLFALLDRQAREAGRRGGEYGAASHREAQFVMAALADEVFLNLEWAGREPWSTSLMEARLSGTHDAGERFFERADRLLKERDAVHRDLAAVYLMALSLGFEGKYRGTSRTGELEEYRRRLFSFVFGRNPSLLRGERRLFPQAYAHTVQDAPRALLPHTGRWLAALAGVAVLYLLVSHGLWRDVTLPLREVNQEITALIGK